MTKKEVLQHCIDIIYESLLMDQINLRYIEERNKELRDDGYEFQAAKSNYIRSIDTKTRQIVIAKKMLEEEKV